MLRVFQSALYCVLFTLLVKYAVRGGAIDGLYFYPKIVQDRAIGIGLTDRDTMNRKRKEFMILFYIVMLAALVLMMASSCRKAKRAGWGCPDRRCWWGKSNVRGL